jgi:antitoxin FitA
MAQLLIRNLDDTVVEALKRRAAMNGRSLAEEVRRTLAAATTVGARGSFRERAAAIRAEIGPLDGPSAVDDLRVLRDRDAIGC